MLHFKSCYALLSTCMMMFSQARVAATAFILFAVDVMVSPKRALYSWAGISTVC